jgi:hypothetical protein
LKPPMEPCSFCPPKVTVLESSSQPIIAFFRHLFE